MFSRFLLFTQLARITQQKPSNPFISYGMVFYVPRIPHTNQILLTYFTCIFKHIFPETNPLYIRWTLAVGSNAIFNMRSFKDDFVKVETIRSQEVSAMRQRLGLDWWIVVIFCVAFQLCFLWLYELSVIVEPFQIMRGPILQHISSLLVRIGWIPWSPDQEEYAGESLTWIQEHIGKSVNDVELT